MAYEKIFAELLQKTPGINKSQVFPQKAADAWQLLTSGYQVELQDVIKPSSLYPCKNPGLVVVKNIDFIALCEHHLLPMVGQCHIAYEPKRQVLGLGKFSEIVNIFSRRLQIQEQLTLQIAEAVHDITQARGVGVLIEARHLCLAMQGVEKTRQSVATSHFIGSLRSQGLALFR